MVCGSGHLIIEYPAFSAGFLITHHIMGMTGWFITHYQYDSILDVEAAPDRIIRHRNILDFFDEFRSLLEFTQKVLATGYFDIGMLHDAINKLIMLIN